MDESRISSKFQSRPGGLNKWAILVLITLVHMLVVGFPWTVMPVLFSTAADELHLSLAQIGVLWGMLPVGCAVTAVFGGMLGDRIGFTKAVGIGCFAVASANLLRGFSTNLATLSASMFLTGATVALIFPNLQRMPAVFFPPRQLSIATGINISGFAIGGAITTALGATVFMPLAGSWRNVLFLYSGLCALMGIVWFIVMRRASDNKTGAVGKAPERPSFRASLAAVFRVKEVWLLSLGNLGVVGAFISLNGYLPVYLERIGLPKSMGDTMSSTLFLASIAGAIGVPVLADRIGGPKAVMIGSAIATAAAIAMMTIPSAPLFWILIPLLGCLTQGVGTLVIAHAVQVKQIGSAYAGTALGLIGACANLGGFIMPLIGGRLAETNQTWPFLLWSLASLSGTVCFLMLNRVKGEPAAASAR